jgi:hypothetical protein
MPIWLQILITAVIVPVAGFSVKVLYGVGQVMGKIDEKLSSHDDRIGRLEDTVYQTPPTPTTTVRRRKSL